MLFPLLPLRLGGSLFPPLRIQCKNQNRERFPISSSPLSLVAAACCSFHVSFVCLLELGIALLAAACCSLISDILRIAELTKSLSKHDVIDEQSLGHCGKTV